MNIWQRCVNSFRGLWRIGLAWLAAALLSPVAAYAQDSGSITGRVVTEDGKALANVRVFLSASGADPSRSVSRSTSTAEDGNFQFNNLPYRSYQVSASGQQGYVVKPRSAEEQSQMRFRPGDSVTVTMIRGGVITGRVTNLSGDPLVSIPITALRIRNAEGDKFAFVGGGQPQPTDDRGVYRIYGLMPGTYVVVANNNSPNFIVNTGTQSPYYGEVPTYHPSSTRDTAAEVTVTSGGEATGIDIRYRGDAGHAVSGTVSGGVTSGGNSGTGIMLRSVTAGVVVGNASVQPGLGEAGFAIYGVPDGEYELTATRGNSEAEEFWHAAPRRVTVKGTDVTGVELRMSPAATIAGRVTIEKSPNVCDAKLKASTEEMYVIARRDEKSDSDPSPFSRIASGGSTPDEKGNFKINRLAPGRYRLQTNLNNETWFVKSIQVTSSAAAPTGKPTTARPAATDLARASVPLKSGEKFPGVTITVSDGGASLRGKVVTQEGTKPSSRLLVHLIPAEPTAADDVLRYTERVTANNGVFAFVNLAPGKYWLLARAVSDAESTDRPPQPIAWDAAERAKLRKEAEAAKNEIELKACQRVKDHVLRF